ncbi:hypothetical protein BO82DRAFT_334429 [Aspergillus uvarum CBS 121591]|uniref:Zn(2)-C6 fungal-type domain-containing protein n=1 Tax=Aspergillus uvarum CBS 121591 TaxID=1448315 RepID=A0A319CA14_9EURO|nr:hypothetical protein BO82DRAFT_334429 [Aspergillus uvarum CBS 121591]PYH82074.1 hypothetical protein BO82DRAFT_334429 [Aspergillus uvarum CBS 121591]
MQTFFISRKRPVTACTECRRRKQKCDRERPCNMCAGRNVPDKCTYEYPESSDDGSMFRADQLALQPPPLRINDDQPSMMLKNQSIRNQIGYGRSTEQDTLSELFELMGDDGELQALNSTSSESLTAQTMRNLSDLYAKIPSQAITRELIELYFSEANWYFAVLEKYYFEKLYSSWCARGYHSRENAHFEGWSRDLLFFPALMCQVLAVALQFAPPGIPCFQVLGIENFTQRDSLSSEFSSWGVDIARVLGRHNPAITAVQNDLMRALWLKNSSRGREAWHVLGGAIRMAQDLGLHQQAKVIQEPESPLEETLDLLWYDEYKRRLWIKLYSWDSHMAFTLGRPRAINTNDCTITPPLDRDIPANPSITIPTALYLHEPPSSFTPHLFQYAICQQAHEVMSLGARRRHTKDYSWVRSIHDRILSLLDNLPPVHRPVHPDTSWDSTYVHIPKQRQQIATAAHSFLMALHRPHSKTHVASRDAAIEAALSVLDAQERLFDLMATRYSNIYALSVYTVEASIFLSVTALECSPLDPAISYRIDRAIEKARGRLEVVKERVSLANSALQILNRCSIKMQLLSQSQFHAPTFTAHHPNQMTKSAPFNELGIAYPSEPAPRNPMPFQTSNTLFNVEPGEIETAGMFEDFTGSNFNIESWVQQIAQMNGSGSV